MYSCYVVNSNPLVLSSDMLAFFTHHLHCPEYIIKEESRISNDMITMNQDGPSIKRNCKYKSYQTKPNVVSEHL